MARYSFHLYDDMVVRDEGGLECPDMVAVMREAARNARSIAAEEVLAGSLNLDHRIEVEDANGLPVLTLHFRDALVTDG